MSKKLDDASKDVNEQFVNAADGKQPEEQQRPSTPTPTPQPAGMNAYKPGGELQRSVDVPLANQQMSDKAKELIELNKSITSQHKAQKELDLKNEHNKNSGRENSGKDNDGWDR